MGTCLAVSLVPGFLVVVRTAKIVLVVLMNPHLLFEEYSDTDVVRECLYIC